MGRLSKIFVENKRDPSAFSHCIGRGLICIAYGLGRRLRCVPDWHHQNHANDTEWKRYKGREDYSQFRGEA